MSPLFFGKGEGRPSIRSPEKQLGYIRRKTKTAILMGFAD